MARHEMIQGAACIAAVATGAGIGMSAVAANRGKVGGAPGISKSLSRIGHLVGGGMLAGVGVVAGAATLAGIIVYQGLTQIEEQVF